MTEAPEQPQFVWTCPKCGRKVPARLDICRCGVRREPGSPEELDPRVEASPTRVQADSREPDAAGVESKNALEGSSALQWVFLLTVAALVIPGALGVQEAGGVFLCRLLGLDEGAGLTLMTLKRAREQENER